MKKFLLTCLVGAAMLASLTACSERAISTGADGDTSAASGGYRSKQAAVS